MKKSSYLLAATAALSLAYSAPAKSQSADPAVTALTAQAAEAYRNLKSFSETMETVQGANAASKTVTKLVIQKPNFVSATIVRGTDTRRFVVDGTTYYTDTSKDATKYIKAPSADFSTSINTLAANGGAGVGLLPILLTSPKAEQQMIPGKPKSVKKIADMTVGSDSCDVIQAVLGNAQQQFRYTFAFAKSDHLLRKLTVTPDKDGAEAMLAETYSEVNASPTIPAGAFKYSPKAGAVATDPPKDPPMYDERLKPGAAPFPLKGVDLAGKAVSYDAYKGKVLLVDFWATWCGPCVGELPNVVEAYQKYHSKGFEVLGISLDQANSKPKLEAFIKEHKMPWPQVYDGKYWQADNAVAYGVQSIPFTLLIGKDGKIAAVGARGPALAPAIEAALKK